MQENDDIYQLSEVASLYYEENYTQERIAKVLGLSRSRISRMLIRSRVLGLVNIQVYHSIPTSPVLREELMRLFGLKDVEVMASTALEEPVLNQVGALAARYLDRYIQERRTGSRQVRTIGISWGTSLLAMLRALHPLRHVPVRVVQLVGSIDGSGSLEVNSPEIARRLAAAYGGECCYVHAPLLVADATIRNGLLKERSLSRTFQIMEQMDMAIVGIGGAHRGASGLVEVGYLGENELTLLQRQGAVGDICGYYFDRGGRLCVNDLQCRTIAVPLETLHKVPFVLAVASGASKAEAVLGALRTGIINALVTDEKCALELLQMAKEDMLGLLG